MEKPGHECNNIMMYVIHSKENTLGACYKLKSNLLHYIALLS